MPRNTDPTQPWNDRATRNDPTAPWNDLSMRDDPSACWNDMAGEGNYEKETRDWR